MKRALVFYLYGNRNAGDMAICLGAIELLKSQGYEITMVSRFSEAEEEYHNSKNYLAEYYPEVHVYPGPFSFEREFSKVKKLVSYGTSFMKVLGIVPDKQTKQLIKQCDVVFFNGGNLLRGESPADYMRLMALFYPIELAKKAGKPVYCLPQSTAGISTVGKKLLGKYLKCCDKIFIREQISYDALKKRFPELPFEVSTDLAFLCNDTEQAAKTFNSQFVTDEKRKIALILRNTGIGDIGELPQDVEQKLLDILKKYVCIHTEYEYWIVVQTKKDAAVSERFINEVNSSGDFRIVESHDPLVLREIYKHMEFTITMRLHAGILSLSALTPVIGLFSEVWGLKNPGIMKDYGMPYIIAEQDGEVDFDHLVNNLSADMKSKIKSKISIFADQLVYGLESIQ